MKSGMHFLPSRKMWYYLYGGRCAQRKKGMRNAFGMPCMDGGMCSKKCWRTKLYAIGMRGKRRSSYQVIAITIKAVVIYVIMSVVHSNGNVVCVICYQVV